MFERAKCSVQCALCVMRRLHAFGLCPVPCLRCHVPCAMLCTVYFCWVLCAAPGTVSSMSDQAMSCVMCPVSCALCPVPCTLLSALRYVSVLWPVVCALYPSCALRPATCTMHHTSAAGVGPRQTHRRRLHGRGLSLGSHALHVCFISRYSELVAR